MNRSVKNILLVGVGGQGIIRASDILSAVLMSSGYDVKKSEVHGMAQRGGCVSSHIRYGQKVYSPISKKGDVDILVSFEKLEALRYLDYMKPEGKIIINEEEVYPLSVSLGTDSYPRDVENTVKKYFCSVKGVNASEAASKVGNKKMANTVMLGAISPYLDVKYEIWEKVLRQTFPEKLIAKNIEAFNLGRGA